MNFTPAQASHSLVKQKAPASRAKPVTPVKGEKIVNGQDSREELGDFNPVNEELEKSATYWPVYESPVTGKWSWMRERKLCS